MSSPDGFLSLVFHEFNEIGDDLALCAGFERGEWRGDQLADHIMEWLPEFALNYSERMEIGHHNAVKMAKKAARLVYQTEKYGLRGEFGEILLHIAIRQVYKTVPAVSKIYYKSSVNETVKGFDAVHVVVKGDEVELWIGETKFYSDIKRAIFDVSNEVIDHLETDYLRSEFILIKNKVDPVWPAADKLNGLLDANVSLDSVFERICIPILLTYESGAVVSAKRSDAGYLDSIKAEASDIYERLRSSLARKYMERFSTALPLVVHVILVPIKSKENLIAALDTRLKAMQI